MTDRARLFTAGDTQRGQVIVRAIAEGRVAARVIGVGEIAELPALGSQRRADRYDTRTLRGTDS